VLATVSVLASVSVVVLATVSVTMPAWDNTCDCLNHRNPDEGSGSHQSHGKNRPLLWLCSQKRRSQRWLGTFRSKQPRCCPRSRQVVFLGSGQLDKPVLVSVVVLVLVLLAAVWVVVLVWDLPPWYNTCDRLHQEFHEVSGPQEPHGKHPAYRFLCSQNRRSQRWLGTLCGKLPRYCPKLQKVLFFYFRSDHLDNPVLVVVSLAAVWVVVLVVAV